MLWNQERRFPGQGKPPQTVTRDQGRKFPALQSAACVPAAWGCSPVTPREEEGSHRCRALRDQGGGEIPAVFLASFAAGGCARRFPGEEWEPPLLAVTEQGGGEPRDIPATMSRRIPRSCGPREEERDRSCLAPGIREVTLRRGPATVTVRDRGNGGSAGGGWEPPSLSPGDPGRRIVPGRIAAALRLRYQEATTSGRRRMPPPIFRHPREEEGSA